MNATRIVITTTAALALAAAALSSCGGAESAIQWEQVSVGASVAQTEDGGYIITGWTGSNGTLDGDAILLKLSSDGDQMWARRFGGEGADAGRSVCLNDDGGYMIAGWTNSYGAGESDIWLIKTDAQGGPIWEKTFGAPRYDGAFAILQAPQGGYVVAGWGSPARFSTRIWAMGLDENGATLWENALGGTFSTAGSAIQPTSDGGYVISGTITTFEAGRSNMWLTKIDSSGEEVWRKSHGGDFSEGGGGICPTPEGGFMLAGWSNAHSGSETDIWLIKTNDEGNRIWDKTFGGTESEEGYCIEPAPEGGYVVAGWTGSDCSGQSDIWLIKIDPEGNLIWDRKFGGEGADRVRSMQPTADGGYILLGESEADDGATRIFVLKTNGEGNRIWDRTFGLETPY